MKKLFLIPAVALFLLSCEKSISENAKTVNDSHQTSENKNEMVALMDKIADKMHAPKTSGNNDTDFSNMMIEHHNGAVEMSELLLNKGKDPELQTFAQKVIDAQTQEINLMEKFQNETEKSADSQDFQQALNQSMAAMMNKEIKIYNDSDKDYAAQMIPHHQSAVEMAKAYLKFGKNPQLLKLSEDIIRAQNTEIAELQNWLAKK
ncbi:DUF305 domain-containing protein [Chryseobacterium sp. MP_3.2]|uniref:DUF305 domain-containing protein n=1 Tax=Chryseobacterium sp. MP_3.2 TaxID=3071712 RepID=UPI002DFD7569|nr:uncharacterized protein (DUF305 family) [Chryseobacterium sp. MP_3.2]